MRTAGALFVRGFAAWMQTLVCNVLAAAGYVHLWLHGSYFAITVGSADMPILRTWSLSWPWSKTILTGIRCTTFT